MHANVKLASHLFTPGVLNYTCPMNDDYLMIESQISSSQNLLQEYVLKILQASCQNFNFVLEVVERNSFEYI